jgi:hypothetical protein
MNELSGLELRKALITALGWKLFNYESGMYATTPKDIADALTNDGYTLEGWSESREAWEFKPEADPAVSEPELLKFCTKYELLFDLYSTRDSRVSCALYRPDHNGVHAHVFGATPSEARARAMLKALSESLNR